MYFGHFSRIYVSNEAYVDGLRLKLLFIRNYKYIYLKFNPELCSVCGSFFGWGYFA
jgi:hypothetical protein